LSIDEPQDDPSDPIMGKVLNWTDDTLMFHVEAVLLDVEKDIAVLKKKDGKIVRVPIKRLCPLSQHWARLFVEKVTARENKEKLTKVAVARI
jgi:hypothetical protein